MVSDEKPGDSTPDCAWSGVGDEVAERLKLTPRIPAPAPLPIGLIERLMGRVSEEDVDGFTPDRVDSLIRASYASGIQTVSGIRAFVKSCLRRVDPEGAKTVRVSANDIRLRLADPVRALWYREGAEKRLPGYCVNVYLALLKKVVQEGNVPAARIFLRRFDPGFRESERQETLRIEAKAELSPGREATLIERLRSLTEGDDAERAT